MIDEEKDKEILKQIQKEFEDMLVNKYGEIPIKWFLLIGTSYITLFSGNSCALCSTEQIIEWIKENNLIHLEIREDERIH